MKKDIIKQIILDNQEKDYRMVKNRYPEIDTQIRRVHCFTGIRRCGKTYQMYEVMRNLMTTIDKENVVYINFEDERIFPLQIQDLDEILKAYSELYPQKQEENIHFFFDEIQEVPGWEKFIRRIYDSGNYHIYISGSSAKLLGKEIAAELRGRSLTKEVFPLSFKEFLLFKNISYEKLTSRKIALLQNQMAEYLRKGGFPELVDADKEMSKKIMQEYLSLIIYRDLVERYKVSNLFFMKYLVKFCFNNISELISYNKLYHDFKSQGLVFGRDTLYEYMAYLEDSYVIYTVPMYSKSIRDQLRNPRKLYSVDTGFKPIVSFSEDKGKLYENTVYMQLRRKYREIYYYKGKQEVDFYVPEVNLLINVSYSIEDTKTFYREATGLMEAMKILNIKKSCLINADKDEQIVKEGKTIRVIPLWMWLLY